MFLSNPLVQGWSINLIIKRLGMSEQSYYRKFEAIAIAGWCNTQRWPIVIHGRALGSHNNFA